MQNYTLKCLKSDEKFEDEYTLHYNDGALVQAVYREKFQPIEKEGMYGDTLIGYRLRKQVIRRLELSLTKQKN